MNFLTVAYYLVFTKNHSCVIPSSAFFLHSGVMLQNGQVSIWRKSILPTGSYALAIFYTQISGGASMLSLVLSDVGIVGHPLYNITEVLSGTFMGTYKPWYTLNCAVNPSGALLFQAIALPSNMAL